MRAAAAMLASGAQKKLVLQTTKSDQPIRYFSFRTTTRIVGSLTKLAAIRPQSQSIDRFCHGLPFFVRYMFSLLLWSTSPRALVRSPHF
jgi:hypothetical protein